MRSDKRQSYQPDWLKQFLAAYHVDETLVPSPELKGRIMHTLSQLGNSPAFEVNDLPLINACSDAGQWQRTVAAIQPPETYRDLHSHALRQDEKVEQFLIWVRQSIKSQAHHNERMSFLILEGRCECTIVDELIQLKAGDFLTIPLNLDHSMRVLSETPVKAILQRLKIAA